MAPDPWRRATRDAGKIRDIPKDPGQVSCHCRRSAEGNEKKKN